MNSSLVWFEKKGHFFIALRTMCDFLDFNLTFFSIMCIQVVARLPPRLRLTFLKIFLHSAGPFSTAPFKKISKNIDFSL